MPKYIVILALSALALSPASAREIKLKVGESVRVGENVVSCGKEGNAGKPIACLLAFQQVDPEKNAGNVYYVPNAKKGFTSLDAVLQFTLLRYEGQNCRPMACTVEAIREDWNDGNGALVRPHMTTLLNIRAGDEFVALLRKLGLCY